MSNRTKSARIRTRNEVLRHFCNAMLVKRSIEAQVAYEAAEYAARNNG